jgi:hypothetical protein
MFLWKKARAGKKGKKRLLYRNQPDLAGGTDEKAADEIRFMVKNIDIFFLCVKIFSIKAF